MGKKPKKIKGLLAYWGQIVIGDYYERLYMPIADWPIERYKQQWKERLERIAKNDVSCLVATVQHLGLNALVELWALYKEKDTMVLQNKLLTRDMLKETNSPLDLNKLTIRTCYGYVNPLRKTVTRNGNKVLEWKISQNDFFRSAEALFMD